MALDLAVIEKETPKKSAIPRLAESTYMARIYSVVDFGIQKQTDWQTGKETDPKATVMVTFQIPSESVEIEDKDTGEKKMVPRYIGKEFNLSTFERSNLMKMVNAIAPGLSNLSELLNKQGMIQVGSTKNDNAKISSVMACPNGMEVGELTVDTLYFDSTFPDKELFDKLPEWQQERIVSALNWQGWPEEEVDVNAAY